MRPLRKVLIFGPTDCLFDFRGLLSSCRAWNQTIYVDLWDTEGEEEIHINKVLIEKGFAQETDHTVSNPWNIEGTVSLNPHKTVGLPG